MINRNLNDLNRDLNELKRIFDQIESYNTDQNIGLRSLKNIGVWLCIYALTDDDHKTNVINELAQKANLTQNDEILFIKKLADALVQPQILATVINDYEKANGAFTLTVNSAENLTNLVNKIKEKNYGDHLIKHVQLDPDQDADLVFLMKNIIKFNWSKSGYLVEPGEFKKIKDKFQGETIDYLEANNENHNVEYGIVEHNKRLFHVVRLGTLQKDNNKEAKRTNTYLIESVDANDAFYLQKDYFDIINLIKNRRFDNENTYHLLKTNKQAAQSVAVHGKLAKYNQFDFTVRFPQILDTLSTTEQRLGIYEHFVGKNIANLRIDRIQYIGKRELTYDEKGGEIKNREEVRCFTESACMNPPNVIDIRYTVANRFMMIYEAENGADYYPYLIADPRNDLKKTFDAKETYPDQQKLIGFASTGNSLFSQLRSNISTITNNAAEKMIPRKVI